MGLVGYFWIKDLRNELKTTRESLKELQDRYITLVIDQKDSYRDLTVLVVRVKEILSELPKNVQQLVKGDLDALYRQIISGFKENTR